MKTSKSVIFLLLLGGLLAFNQALPAADSTIEPPQAPAKTDAPAKSGSRVDKLTKKISLTPEQKAKLEPIYQEETEKLKEVTQRSDAERAKIREGFRAKVKASGVFTEAQYAQWLTFQTPLTKTTAPKTKKAQAN